MLNYSFKGPRFSPKVRQLTTTLIYNNSSARGSKTHTCDIHTHIKKKKNRKTTQKLQKKKKLSEVKNNKLSVVVDTFNTNTAEAERQKQRSRSRLISVSLKLL